MDGMKKSDAVRLLRRAGYRLARQGSRHEVWVHPVSNEVFALPRHSWIRPTVAQELRKQVVRHR